MSPTAARGVGQEAVDAKSNETTAIPVLIERLATQGGLKGALVTIDAMATNPTLAAAIRAAAANSLLAVKANQPTLRAEIAAFFAAADPTGPDGEREPFCRLRTDYSDRVPATILGG